MDFAMLRAGLGTLLLAGVLTGCNQALPPDEANSTLAPPRVAIEAGTEQSIGPIEDADGAVAPASHQAEIARLDLSWITDEYFAALIVHPRQVLQKLPIAGESRAWLDAAAAELGVTLTELQQVCFLLGPPEPGPESSGPPPLTTAWIFRFTTPAGQERMMKRFLGESRHREIAHEGRFYFKSDEAPVALCAPDDRTVLLATERRLKRTFTAHPRSRLLTQLAAIQGRPDMAGFLDAAPLRPLLRRAKSDEKDKDSLAASPWARQASEAAARLKEGTFTADFAETPLARLTLEAEDSQAAVHLEELVQGYRATASLLLPAVQKRSLPGEGAHDFSPLLALASDVLAGVTTSRNLRSVAVEMAPPPAMADLPGILEHAYAAWARGAAREERVRRLQQIGLAMHNRHVAHGGFPADSRDVAGRLLLSWRVHLLPWLGEEELYRQFRLDQPWDSPHNASLLARMPTAYQTGGAVQGQTRIVAIVGPGTPFSLSRGPALRDFTDGADQTILLVECGPDRAVPWTQPDDLPFDPRDPISVLGTIEEEGFLALFGDGRVEIIRSEISPPELRDLLTHAGSELAE